MRIYSIMAAVVLLAVPCGCDARDSHAAGKKGETIMTLNVSSAAFADGGLIPARYTADGENVSPPVRWEAAPEGTESIAIISDDPDAPGGTWVHWLIWNIPAGQTDIRENIPPEETLSNGAVQGTTSFGSVGYGGPAPPSGTHRYYFKVYALDTRLDLGPKAVKKDLEKAMQGHILSQGQVMGRYSRR